MKESYITKAFRKTVRERFPEQATVPNSAFGKKHCAHSDAAIAAIGLKYIFYIGGQSL